MKYLISYWIDGETKPRSITMHNWDMVGTGEANLKTIDVSKVCLYIGRFEKVNAGTITILTITPLNI